MKGKVWLWKKYICDEKTIEYLTKLHDVIRLYNVSLIMITATLPFVEKENLFKQFHVNSEIFNLMRASTTRKELRYEMWILNNKILDLVSTWHSKLEETALESNNNKTLISRCIVYCQDIKRIEMIFKLLNRCDVKIDIYHEKLDIKSRERSYKKWINEEIKIFIATNAFAINIDYELVTLIVHHILSTLLIDYS